MDCVLSLLPNQPPNHLRHGDVLLVGFPNQLVMLTRAQPRTDRGTGLAGLGPATLVPPRIEGLLSHD